MDAELVDQRIGMQLKKLRLAHGMSGVAFAKRIDVGTRQLAKYEQGINRINAERLSLIAAQFKIDIGFFFAGLEYSKSSLEVENHVRTDGVIAQIAPGEARSLIARLAAELRRLEKVGY